MERKYEDLSKESNKCVKRYCRYLQDDNPAASLPKSTKTYQRKKRRLSLEKSSDVLRNTDEIDVLRNTDETQTLESDNCTVEEVDICNESDQDVQETEYDTNSISSDFDFEHYSNDTDGECSEDDTDFNVGNDKKLYEQCKLSADESAILVLQFAICHKITGAALLDLLSVIKAHLPEGCHYFSYVSQLKQALMKCCEIPMEIKSYCNKCLTEMSGNDYCKSCKKITKDTSQFIKLSITDQIQSFFVEDGFCNLLKYRFTRVKQNTQNIEDVFDGEMYKALFENNGILSEKFSMSLKLNTDGVSVFKSSSFHLWLVYCQINELPPEKRIQSKYRILAGLWSGKRKPDMNLMFAPIVSELKTLENNGASFTTSDGNAVHSRIIALTGHFDTPAKDDFLQKVHHNGNYGCSFCEEKGKTAKIGNGHTHVYPYNDESSAGFNKARTHESVLENANDALAQKKTVVGIKKKCAFFDLKSFDVVNSISVDYMHTVCLGVVKRMLTIWFNAANKSGPCYIGDKVDEVDQRLLCIFPPNSVTRTPRSIKEHLKHFKASELRVWLLHYSPVCLKGILPDLHYSHFMYLVKGIYLLLSTSISPLDLKESGKCLRSFCLLMENLYGEKYMTINFHLLLHIPDTVRHLGPLWTSSCFSFEDYNGELGNFFHGTQHVEGQILNAVVFSQKLPFYRRKFKQDNDTAAKVLDSLSMKHRVTLKEPLMEDMHVLGATEKKKLWDLPHYDRITLLNFVQAEQDTPVKIFKRVHMHGSVFHSSSYLRVSKRNSFTVKFMHNTSLEYGQIKYFVQIEGEKALALVQSFEQMESIRNQHTELHIKKVHETDHLIAVYLDHIIAKCVYMEIENELYISELPNSFECD